MSARMQVDSISVEQAIASLRGEAGRLNTASSCRGTSALGAFSTVSGLREVGQKLGHVSGFYAPEAVGVLARHMLDAAQISETNLDNTMRADGSLARALDVVNAPGTARYRAATTDFQPNISAANPKASRFTPPQPIAGLESNLLVLHHKLLATNTAAAGMDAMAWHGVMAQAAGATDALFRTKSALATSNETQWVQRGQQRLNQIQRAAATLGARSGAMAGHVEALGTIAAAEQVTASVVVASYLAAPLPAKPIIEQTYLGVFGPRLSAALTATIPMFNQLIPDLATISGDPFRIGEIAEPTAPSFEATPLPQVLQDALIAQGHGDLARATTPAEVVSAYGRPNPDMLEAIAAGATPTQAAAVAAPNMPPTLTPGANPAATAGAQAAGAGAAPVGTIRSIAKGALSGIGGALATPTHAAGVASPPRLGASEAAKPSIGAGTVAGTAKPSASGAVPGISAIGGAGIGAGALSASGSAGSRPRFSIPKGVFGLGSGNGFSFGGVGQSGNNGSSLKRSLGAMDPKRAGASGVGPATAGFPTSARGANGANMRTDSNAGANGMPGGFGAPGSFSGASRGGAAGLANPGLSANAGAMPNGAGGLGKHALAGGTLPAGMPTTPMGLGTGAVPAGLDGLGGFGGGAASARGKTPGGMSAGMGAGSVPVSAPSIGANVAGLGNFGNFGGFGGAGVNPALGGVPGGAPSSQLGSMPTGGSGSTPNAAAGSAGQPRGAAIGGVPMAAGAGAGNQQQSKKSRKVKAVTSAVEREGNLQALLGDAPLVLPSVIGDNTRR